MTEFLHPELNKRLRKVINSSPIFQEGKLRGNFNLLCAAMDRIDTCVAYLNKHSNFPRTEEDFIIFLMFAAMNPELAPDPHTNKTFNFFIIIHSFH